MLNLKKSLLFLILGIVFFPLSRTNSFIQLDQIINKYLEPINPSNSLISSVLNDVGELGHIYLALFIINVLVIALLLFYKHKLEAVLLFLVNSAIPLAVYLKLLFNTTRPGNLNSPAIVESMEKFLSGSYPSLHTLYYTAFWGFIVYITFYLESNFTKHQRIPTSINMSLRWLGILLILSIGISRLYANEHWLSDVIGGYFFGFSVLYLFIAIHEFWVLKSKKKQELLQ